MKKAKIIFTSQDKGAEQSAPPPAPKARKKYKQVKPPHDIQVRLKDKGLKGRLRAKAEGAGLSLNALVEQIIREYLK